MTLPGRRGKATSTARCREGLHRPQDGSRPDSGGETGSPRPVGPAPPAGLGPFRYQCPRVRMNSCGRVRTGHPRAQASQRDPAPRASWVPTSVLGRTRTCGLLLRRQPLYPPELRGRQSLPADYSEAPLREVGRLPPEVGLSSRRRPSRLQTPALATAPGGRQGSALAGNFNSRTPGRQPSSGSRLVHLLRGGPARTLPGAAAPRHRHRYCRPCRLPRIPCCFRSRPRNPE